MYRRIGTGTQIIFFYKTAAIVDRLKLYSSLPQRSVADQVPDAAAERVITSDDLTIINSECSRALDKLFQIAYKLSAGVNNSLIKNRTLTIVDDNESLEELLDNPDYVTGYSFPSYGFRLYDKNGYNHNLLPLIDSHIEEALVTLVLARWYALTRQVDLATYELGRLPELLRRYNNSLTELYKPPISYDDIVPDMSVVAVTTVDGVITTVGEIPVVHIDPSTTSQEVLYFTSFGLFPAVGLANIIYVDKSNANMWYYSKDPYPSYRLYSPPAKTYVIGFGGIDYLLVTHNLGKYLPTVVLRDSQGDEWLVDVQIIDINQTIVQWNGLKTGELYFS